MNVTRVTQFHFTQKENTSKSYPKINIHTDGYTSVILNDEEEKLYRTSLKQTWDTIGKYALASAGILAALAALTPNRKMLTLPAAGLGALIGVIIGAVNAIVTGKSAYINLPYQKRLLENGLARQNLAALNTENRK